LQQSLFYLRLLHSPCSSHIEQKPIVNNVTVAFNGVSFSLLGQFRWKKVLHRLKKFSTPIKPMKPTPHETLLSRCMMIPHRLLSLATALVALTFSIPSSGLQAGEDGLVVVADGKSPYVIAITENAEPRRIGEAAEFLRDTIKQATGVELPIVKESEVAPETPAIYLGRSDAARKAGIDVESIEGWSYLNRAVGPDIFLVGEDRETKVGASHQGTPIGIYGSLKAVTAFLEDQAGVRFLHPGELGTNVPTSDRLVVDAGMDTQWEPVFDYVIGRAAGFIRRHQGRHNKAFAIANHLHGPTELQAQYGGHSYYYAVPKDKYGETNPEYFAEIGGVRTVAGNHLCISNPEVQELMLKEMEKYFDLGYEWVELEQTDGYLACECVDCEAIHPDHGERIWITHRKLAEEIKKRRPGKTVMMTSYRPNTLPPTSFDAFPDNVAMRFTRYRPEDFAIWQNAGFDLPFGIYTTNWLTIHPRISPWVAINQLRLFRDNNVHGIYLCGGLNMDGGDNWYPWGLGGPGYYAFFKGLHDPDVDPVAVRAEYINSAFGEAAAPMQTFFEALDDRMDHFWHLYRRSPENGPPSRMMGPGDFETHFYPPRTLDQMTQSLDRAKELAKDEAVKARLKLIELEFNYLKSLALVHHLYRAYLLSPSWETLALVEEKLKEFQSRFHDLYTDEQPIKIDGVPSPFSGLQHRFAARLGGGGAPFNWDFDLLREKQVLPGVEMKEATVKRIAPIQIDGDLNKPEWKNIPAQPIGEIAFGQAPNETSFKVAYDENNLYLALEAGISAPDALDHIVPVGRDGATWRQESMEMMIDPLGTRRMYYHFAVNPANESSLERRFGYQEDPDHPLYQDFEWDWRGDWEYVAKIDKDRQVWTAEIRIPFATLGVDPATSGDIWTMNIGRNEIPAGSKHGTAYLWSPNIESRTFHDRSTFGRLGFE